ncbi:hypothetical protein J6590_104919 [Homalodisca vitripennis]|nr:hypothetical protein J6590_104919 [Homalodisca vitripennis]
MAASKLRVQINLLRDLCQAAAKDKKLVTTDISSHLTFHLHPHGWSLTTHNRHFPEDNSQWQTVPCQGHGYGNMVTAWTTEGNMLIKKVVGMWLKRVTLKDLETL